MYKKYPEQEADSPDSEQYFNIEDALLALIYKKNGLQIAFIQADVHIPQNKSVLSIAVRRPDSTFST